MKVAVVGPGRVGTAIGGQLLKSGHKVQYASRTPSGSKAAELTARHPTATVGGIQDSVAWSDVVLLTVPGSHDAEGIHRIATSLGNGVKGKVVIDATNPLSEWPGLEVRWEQGISGGEVLADALPDSHIFKSFNTVGLQHFEAPGGDLIHGEQLRMLYAGDEAKASQVAEFIRGVGLQPLYVGPIRYARNLEAIAELWIHLAIPGAGATHADWGMNFHFQPVFKDDPSALE